MPVEGGEASRVLEALSDWSRYALTNEGIYFHRRETSSRMAEQIIEFMNFSTGKTQTAARIPNRMFIGMAVSPDGKSLLYTQDDSIGSDLMLVENFPASARGQGK